MGESKVQIAPDNTTSGNHSVRTETVLPLPVSDTLGAITSEQQVVSIADAMGNIVSTTAGALETSDTTTQHLLQILIGRIDLLLGCLDKKYSPPDAFGSIGE